MAIKRNLLLWIVMALSLLVLAACATVSGPSAEAVEPTLEVQGGQFSLGRGSLYAILSATGYGQAEDVAFTFAASPTLTYIACSPGGKCSVKGQADKLINTTTSYKQAQENANRNGRTRELQAYVWTEGDLADLRPKASDFANPGWRLGFDVSSKGCVSGVFTDDKGVFYSESKNITVDGGVRYLYMLTASGEVVLESTKIMGDFAYQDNASCTVD